MKKVILLTAVALLFIITSCKTYELGGEVGKQISVVPRDYEIKGPIRIEGREGKNAGTYDGLLKAARDKYGSDVDVINVKIDGSAKGKKSWYIMNGYAVKYK